MSHETFDEQVAAYALDALDAGERAAFEAHLAAGCARCESALRESREALAAVALDEPAAVPPPDVKAALLRRVAADARPVGGRAETRRLWLRWAAATAAAMIVGGFLTGMFVAARYEAELGRVARETSRLREDLSRREAALQARVAAYQAVVELLRDPATRVIAMSGAGPSPEARGRVVWHETAGGQVLVSNLPVAPEGKAYEMWTIAGGKPTAAGVFQVDASGQAIHRLPSGSGRVDVFAITLEPAAGVPAPTGPIVLASTK
jgi:anti-sigma factor RsiW